MITQQQFEQLPEVAQIVVNNDRLMGILARQPVIAFDDLCRFAQLREERELAACGVAIMSNRSGPGGGRRASS